MVLNFTVWILQRSASGSRPHKMRSVPEAVCARLRWSYEACRLRVNDHSTLAAPWP